MANRQIIALGGGGFSMEPWNPLLDLFVLKQCAKAKPKICFVPTASGDSQTYIDNFYTGFGKLACEPSHLSLFRGHTAEIEKFIFDQDIIYVGGGNTRNLLTLWRDWGLDVILRKAYDRGTIMAGISAGSLCWFEEGVTDSIPGRLSSLRCLGWIKSSNCPHFDGEAARRPSYHQMLERGDIGPGVATDDGAALHFVNEELKRVVASRPGSRAYKMSLREGKAFEEVLVGEYLGGEAIVVRRAVPQDAAGIHIAHMRSIVEICGKDYSTAEIQAWGGRPYRAEQRLEAIKSDRVWVVEKRGTIEGYAHMRVQDQGGKMKAHIFGLYLTPDVNGKSIGKALAAMMLEDAKANKVVDITLESTLTAHGFYHKVGFVDDGGAKMVEINGVPIQCFPMKIELK